MERKLIAQKLAVVLLLSFLAAACTREAKKGSQIAIKFPEAAQSLQISRSLTAFSTKWQLSDPSAPNQLNCYAVAVENTDSPTLQGQSCFTTAGQVVAKPGLIVGGFAAGSTQQIEVPSGANRRIHLIGFQTDDPTLCKDVNASAKGLDPAHFSAPYMIDAVSLNLEPGTTVEVELTIPSTFNANAKFEECMPFAFGRGGTTPALMVTSVSPVTGPAAGGTSISVFGAGFDAATTVTVGGSACTSPVVTSSMITCTTSAHASGAADIVVTRGVAQQTLSSAFTYQNAPALLSLDQANPFTFPTLAVGNSVTQTFTVMNTGDDPATSLNGFGLSAPYSFSAGYPGTGGTCASTLSGGSTCTIVVTFAPGGVGGSSDSIELDYYDGVTTQSLTRAVQGTAITPANLMISHTGHDFGILATGASADHTFTITNSGASTASGIGDGGGLAAPFSFKGGSFPGTGGTCAATLTGAATCTIVVTYSPTVTGVHSDTIVINYNDSVSAQSATNSIQGIGDVPASLSVSDGPTYDFGTKATGSQSDKTFTLTNTGNFTATSINGIGLSAPFSYKGGSFPGAGGTCAASLTGSNNCTFVVTYSPSATSADSDAIDIAYNDGANVVNVTRNVQGTGASPALVTISDDGYVFPDQGQGGTVTKTFTLTNTGGFTATGFTPSGMAAPFGFSGGSYPGTGGTCITSLAPAATCTVVVAFAPSSSNTFTETLDMAYYDGAAAQNASVNFSGDADVDPPAVTVFASPTPPTTNIDMISITLNFSEPVTGLAPADFNVTGGSVQFLSGAGANYRLFFAPSTGGAVGISLNPGTVSDAVGNPNSAGSSTLSYSFTMPPGNSSLTGLPSAPSPRHDFASVWTGTTWFIYGGHNGAVSQSGGFFYDPTNNSWSAANTTNQPTARDEAAAIYNGNHILVWGGDSSSPVNTGAVFDTGLNTWSPVTTTSAPTARYRHTMLWNGKKAFVWGGLAAGGTPLNSGGMLDIDGNVWSAITTSGAPSARQGHAAVMADQYMVIWGGGDGMGNNVSTGGRYDMFANSWTAVSGTGAPSAREDFAYVWTGRHLIVWGGAGPGGVLQNNGAMYDPQLNTWSTLPNGGETPSARRGMKAVWTGTHMIISGGVTLEGESGEHFALDYVTGNWMRLRSSIAEPRIMHQAVWTGSELIEWGGRYAANSLDSGNKLAPDFSGPRVKQIAMGDTHACAVSEAGKVKCWGYNNYGQLGYSNVITLGDGPGEMGANLPYIDLGPGLTAIKISVGDGFTCALLNNFSVKCWGGNTLGQLGDGSTIAKGDQVNEMGSFLGAVPIGARAIDISAGSGHACAVTEFGQVKCWGYGGGYQLGNGSTSNSLTPILVSSITSGALQVLAGSSHTCARTFNSVSCWGTNTAGQIGDGTLTNRLSPVTVNGMMSLGITGLTGRGNTMCATYVGGTKCWGENAYGSLGNGNTTQQPSPVSVMTAGLTHVSQGGTHACGIWSGNLSCWGAGVNGALGSNATSNIMSASGTPIVAHAAGVLGVSAGLHATCAWYGDGSVRCWGQNNYGRLGHGNTTTQGAAASSMEALLNTPIF